MTTTTTHSTHVAGAPTPRPSRLAAYTTAHQDRTNLAVHAVAVPVFLAGTVALVGGALTLAWPLAAGGALAMLLSIGVQGAAHKREPVAVAPFAGPRDALARILIEQWLTFPRFVLSGAFSRAWRGAH
jgi:hypothetical protein